MPQFQIFNEKEAASIRKGGAILRACLEHVAALVEPGITTKALDTAAEEFIRSHYGAVPGFLGYQNYPATLCTSVNDECVHGLPGDRVLQNGDIIAIDCGVLLDELNTDACVSVGVGTISDEAQSLMDSSKNALEAAVQMVKAGVRIGDISSLIQKHVEGDGFAIVRALTGHGLGTTLHQFPDIPNFGKKGTGPILPVGTLIAIEPIVSVSCREIRDADDGWTLSTKDGSLSAHFENTVLTTEEGCEVVA